MRQSVIFYNIVTALLNITYPNDIPPFQRRGKHFCLTGQVDVSGKEKVKYGRRSHYQQPFEEGEIARIALLAFGLNIRP